MERNKIVIESYGLNPPQNSKPFWEDNNAFNEDKVIFKIDLQKSLQKLPPTERKILILCNQGYSIREIAEMLNIPTMTVHHNKDRAIKKLKEMMNGGNIICDVFATDTDRVPYRLTVNKK